MSKSAMAGVPPDTDGRLEDDWGCVITDSYYLPGLFNHHFSVQ